MRAPEPPPTDPPLPTDGSGPGQAALGTLPPSVPDYELIRRIGGGAYGDVWLARSTTGVLRAVKIVWRHTFEDERPFQREFEGIQRFERLSHEHPSQLALLHVGRNEAAGCFYYVMELADDARAERSDGVMESWSDEKKAAAQYSTAPILHDPVSYVPHTLRADLGHGRLPAARVLEIGLALTEALAHLHTNGLVHRDVKPSNVIFVNGRPKLADIGLVTDAGDTRSIVGTEGYLAPEGPGTPQADIFALGKVLYEAATGLDRRQLPQLPPDLRAWSDAKLVFELNEIFLKACAADPVQRYDTAEAMRADLELLRVGQSVKRLRVVERRLALLTRIGVLAAILAVIAAVVLLENYRARRIATQGLVRLHVTNGTRMMNEGDLFGSLLSFTEALRLDSGDARREESDRIRIASVLSQCPKLVGVYEHEQPVNQAVLSPDDRWLLTGSNDRAAKVWDLASGTTRFTLEHSNGPVYSVGFSPDGSLMVTSCSDEQAHLWSAATGKELPLPIIRQVGKWQSVPHPCFSPDSRKLLTLAGPKTLQIWNVMTGEPIGQPLQHDHNVSFCTFSLDGHHIASVSNDNQARVWDTLTGELRFSFPHGRSVNRVAFSPDSRILATTGADRVVRLWDLSSGKLLPSPLEQRSSVDAVAFSREGGRLLTKSSDRSVQVWDIESRQPLILPIKHDVVVFNVTFNPDGRSVATVSGGNLLQMWDADTGELKIPSLRHGDWREPVVFSSDGRLVVTFHGEEVRVWDVGTIDLPALPLRPVGAFAVSSISRNGRFRVEIAGDNTVRTIDLRSHKRLPQLIGLVPPIRQAFFSADSEILIAENADTRARIWDPASGEPLTPLLKTSYPLNALGYSLNARSISKSDLPRNDHPVAELVLLAELLYGGRIDDTGGFRPLEASESFARWQQLKATYPEAFRTAPTQAFLWHEQEAKACEQVWNWSSALFHLDYLLTRKPEDSSLRKRREYAQTALENAHRVPGGYLKKAQAIPPRNPSAKPEMVDLSSYYNHSLREVGVTLPSGLQAFAGTAFDVRGIIGLSGLEEKARSSSDPEQITGIQIGRKCRRLHFLHAAHFGASDGTPVGNYVVHYADQQRRTIPIVYGTDVRDWWTQAREPLETQASALVWMGSNPDVQSLSKSLRMFKSTWENPLLDVPVASLDFISSMGEASPFIVAVTAD